MQATHGWQIRRAAGRRIYTGLSRAQVERALHFGKLKPSDLALPPGAARWMHVSVALSQFEEGAGAVGPRDVSVPEWVPMREEGRLTRQDLEQEDPAEMDMMPMIDVTTLLLIFFLVGGVFILQTRVDLPEAQTGAPEMFAEERPVSIVIERNPEDPSDIKIAFEDERLAAVKIDELVEGYSRRVQEGDLPEVVLKAHRRAPFGLVRQVMAKLGEAGVNRISVAVEELR